jgi:hypothetical protein
MPASSSPIPTVQYLRKSTEYQQYSLDHQSTTIQRCRSDELEIPLYMFGLASTQNTSFDLRRGWSSLSFWY